MEPEKATVEGIIRSSDKGGLVAAQKQGQIGHFSRLRHPPNGL
jgi:hypothetical protein